MTMQLHPAEKTGRRAARLTLLLLSFLIALAFPMALADRPQAASAFEQTLQRFPASYREKLRALHQLHPNWVFEPVAVDDDWATVIRRETSPEDINLVSRTSPPAWIKSYTVYDGSSWVPASKDLIEYFMDPRNFLTERDIFQFERLSFDPATQTEAGVRAIFGSNPGLLTLAPLVMTAARDSGASAYLLASRMKQEISEKSDYGIINSARGHINITYPPLTAGGISPCFFTPARQLTMLESLPAPTAQQREWIAGLKENPPRRLPRPAFKYYNLYNIGAKPNPGVLNGARINATRFAMGLTHSDPAYQARYALPWTSQEKAAVGGARIIAANYIAVGQDTMYFQKFAVVGSLSGRYSHQYMQNVQAAAVEGRRYYEGYRTSGSLGNAFTFRIPVYRGIWPTPEAAPSVTPSRANPAALPGHAGQSVQVRGGSTYRVRSRPSTAGTVLGLAGANRIFRIGKAVTGQQTEYGNLWYEISFNGKTAYMVADLNGQTIIP